MQELNRAKLSTSTQPPKEPLIDKTLSQRSPQKRDCLRPSSQTLPANPSHCSVVGRGTTLDSSSLCFTAPLFDAAKQPGSGEAPLLQASRSPLGSYPNTLSSQNLPIQQTSLHQSLGSGLGTTLGPAGGLSAQPFASSLLFPASPTKEGLLFHLPPTTYVGPSHVDPSHVPLPMWASPTLAPPILNVEVCHFKG